MSILVYAEHDEKITIPLLKERPVTIGKGVSNTICFPGDQHLSRRHCEIFFSRDAARFVFRDLGSKNGSTVNGRTIRSDIAFLKEGDALVVGSKSFSFSDADPGDDGETVTMRVPWEAIETMPQAASPPTPEPAQTASTPAARPRAQTAPEFEKGDDIGNYSIVRKVGKGPVATVYLANQPSLSRMVAIKIFPNPSQEAEDDFIDAVQRASALSHSNLMPYFDVGVQPDFLYLVMPFLADGGLDAQASKPLAASEAITRIMSLAEALEYALQECQLTHQNLKSSNIFYDEEFGEVMLSDIGLAEWTAKHASVEARWLPGSAAFTPPERVLGEHPDWRGDQYLLGIVLFTMLTGSPPFSAEDERQLALLHVKKQLPSLNDVNKNIVVAKETAAMLEKMTRRDPDARFSSWREVIDACKACLSAPDAQSQAKPKPKPTVARFQNKSAFNVNGLLGNRMSFVRMPNPRRPLPVRKKQ